MSFYSNHEPESIDACRFDNDPTVPEQYGRSAASPPCCVPASPDSMCPRCRSDFEAWLRQVDAQQRAEYDGIVDILPEGSGVQFADGPLPPDVPF